MLSRALLGRARVSTCGHIRRQALFGGIHGARRPLAYLALVGSAERAALFVVAVIEGIGQEEGSAGSVLMRPRGSPGVSPAPVVGAARTVRGRTGRRRVVGGSGRERRTGGGVGWRAGERARLSRFVAGHDAISSATTWLRAARARVRCRARIVIRHVEGRRAAGASHVTAAPERSSDVMTGEGRLGHFGSASPSNVAPGLRHERRYLMRGDWRKGCMCRGLDPAHVSAVSSGRGGSSKAVRDSEVL